MEHTPGPWKAEKFCIWAGETYVAGTQTGIGETTQQANAKLMAASPGMIDALNAVLEKFNSATMHDAPNGFVTYIDTDIDNQVQAAIKAATN